jgi:hypothetical protein
MGLLDRIGAFERYKVSPTQGTSGLMTGAGRPMSPFAQQAARNIGGALGMDMRSPQEQLQQGLSAIDPNDPQRMAKMYGLLAQFGTPEQRIAATGKMQELAQKQQQQTQLTALRRSLKDRATALKLPASYNETIDNASPEQLGKLAEDLRQQEFADVSKARRQPALNALGNAFGLAPEDIEGLDYEEIEKMGTLGEGTESKRFEKQDGSIVQLPIRGGKVFADGKWQTPVAAGVVEEDPNVSTVINRTEQVGSKVGDTIASSFDTSYNEMIDLKEQAIQNNRALRLVDEGILAGRFSGIEKEVDMIVSGLTGRPTKNATQNTIELMRQRAEQVLANISALGAGSGVSNTDLQFMKDMTAQDLTSVTEEDVLRLLIIERDAIERSRQGFVQDLDYLKNKGIIDNTDYNYFDSKTNIPDRYEFDQSDLDQLDLSGFNPDTQAFLSNYYRAN